MSAISELIDFIEAEESGACWKDAAYAAYDLDSNKSGAPAIKKAVRHLGRDSLIELQSDLFDLGYTAVTPDQVKRWWTYSRIVNHRVRKWPLRRAVGCSQGPSGVGIVPVHQAALEGSPQPSGEPRDRE